MSRIFYSRELGWDFVIGCIMSVFLYAFFAYQMIDDDNIIWFIIITPLYLYLFIRYLSKGLVILKTTKDQISKTKRMFLLIIICVFIGITLYHYVSYQLGYIEKELTISSQENENYNRYSMSISKYNSRNRSYFINILFDGNNSLLISCNKEQFNEIDYNVPIPDKIYRIVYKWNPENPNKGILVDFYRIQ